MVQGHVGVTGNEMVDNKAAKYSCSLMNIYPIFTLQDIVVS